MHGIAVLALRGTHTDPIYEGFNWTTVSVEPRYQYIYMHGIGGGIQALMWFPFMRDLRYLTQFLVWYRRLEIWTTTSNFSQLQQYHYVATRSFSIDNDVTIARVILKKPKIILLDEATSAVDSETEHHISSALRELTKGRTTFIVLNLFSALRELTKGRTTYIVSTLGDPLPPKPKPVLLLLLILEPIYTRQRTRLLVSHNKSHCAIAVVTKVFNSCLIYLLQPVHSIIYRKSRLVAIHWKKSSIFWLSSFYDRWLRSLISGISLIWIVLCKRKTRSQFRLRIFSPQS